MSSNSKGIDKIFLGTVIILLITGFIIFISASMGILAKNSAQFASIVSKQIFFGIIFGSVACFIFSKIDYKIFKRYAFPIFVGSLALTSLVFVPGLGTNLNTFATRWISLFGFTFQPVAVLNIGFIIYWAAWLTSAKEKVSTFKYGLMPMIVILSIIAFLLLNQPDTDSFLILGATCVSMFMVAGGKKRHVAFLIFIGILCVTILAFTRPYVMSRIETYIHPNTNSQTSGYQIQQSLIAVGSGQIFGKGLGQSIQKYKFLPESISDTIFAVLAEEGGFVGCVFVILIFLFFVFRGFKIAIRSPDTFGGLLVVGIVILTILQSFTNIASVLGIIPFSGLPLAFFSQGGTAMLMILVEIGIVLNVSKFGKDFK
ncbi:MAG: putative peptidoglycan glycosyltransferase FtsW [Candidatus Paceibacterota bacterium]|jgi:cell division protein FtsW